MDTEEQDLVKDYGNRIWGQAESVLQDLFAYFDRMAERYGVDDTQRVQAVSRFLGDDLADWYRDWIESDA